MTERTDDDRRFFRQLVAATALIGGTLAAVLLILGAIEVFLLIFGGGLLAVFIARPASWLTRRVNIPYRVAWGLVLLILFGAVVGGIAWSGPRLATYLSDLSDELTEASQQVAERAKQYPAIQEGLQQIPRIGDLFTNKGGDLLSAAFRALSSTFGFITTSVLIVMLGIFFSADPTLYRRGLVRFFPIQHRPRAREVIDDLGDALWWWIVARVISMSLIGGFTAIGLWAFGVPMPGILGVLTALLTFIPNLGAALAAVPPVLLAFEQGAAVALGVAAYYVVLQALESYLVTPLVQQHEISLPPPVTLGAQLVAGAYTGLLGLALAVPLMAVVWVLIRDLYLHDTIERGEDETAEPSQTQGPPPEEP
jgi:predicted PurR-regulated permease PerM